MRHGVVWDWQWEGMQIADGNVNKAWLNLGAGMRMVMHHQGTGGSVTEKYTPAAHLYYSLIAPLGVLLCSCDNVRVPLVFDVISQC